MLSGNTLLCYSYLRDDKDQEKEKEQEAAAAEAEAAKQPVEDDTVEELPGNLVIIHLCAKQCSVAK